jgi:protein ImuB
MMRRILALFLPTLATDRLSRLSGAPAPERPLALVARLGNRRLVTAVGRAAEAAGVAPGMAVADAQALLPELLLADAAPAADAAFLARLAEWCRRWTPFPAVDGADGLRLDVTGCAHLSGGERKLLADVMARFAALGLACRGAIVETPGAAWALAHYGAEAATVVPPGGARAALLPLDISALRLLPEDALLLERLGLKRIAQLAAMPRAALARRFGDRLARRLDEAFGTVAEPISPRRWRPAHRSRLAFAEPMGNPEDIPRAAQRLIEDLCGNLEREGVGARRLVLAAYRCDGETPRVAIGTARPNRDIRHLTKLFEEKLGAIDPGLGIDEMTLDATIVESLAPVQMKAALNRCEASSLSRLREWDGVRAVSERLGIALTLPLTRAPPSPASGRGKQSEGLAFLPWIAKPAKRAAPALPAPTIEEGLATLVDRLAGRLGPENVFRLTPVESHVPERAQQALPVFAPFRPGWAAGAPRPIRLMPSPEPVEAMAPVPDDPPVFFIWRRVRRRVVRADGPERIAPEWWREDAATRDYYRVEDAEGRRYWLFRAGLYAPGATPRWYLHGVFA